MAKKTETQDQEKSISIEPIEKVLLTIEIIGTSDLILNKKARSFEMQEIWKQSNPKGTVMPKELQQNYNLWEKLITSIDWKDPIAFHDEDWSKYTEKEWNNYMTKNQPCISSQAIFGSMYEAFVSFGYKESTGKNGTDIKRAVSFTSNRYPITFASAAYQQKLIPAQTKDRVNVLGQNNVFTGWKTTVGIYTANVAFPAETLIDLLVTAGQFVGVSTQRKNGYGRFTIGEVKVHKLNK